MAFLAGKGHRFKVASTNIRVTMSDVGLDTELLDASSTEGNGWREKVFGLSGGDVNFRMVVDISTTPLTLVGHGQAVALTWYPDAGTSGSNIAGTLAIGKSRIVGEVNGLVTLEGSGSFSGSVTKTGL